MTPEELNNALQSAALTYVQEVKQQDVPLRVNQELAVDIIRTKQYQHRDEISLILEADARISTRLPSRKRSSAAFCGSVAPQTGEEPGIPPLRSIIADGNAQRLLLPDQHEQPLASRDSRVDQVTLQQHVVLRGERDHYCRELRSLRLVDRDRVSQSDLVQFPKVVFHQSLVEADRDLMLNRIDPLNDSDVSVEHILVVVVLRLDDLVACLESPPEPLDGGRTG